MKAPIALFVYNRLQHTQATIGALCKNMGAQDSDIYIFSDAAKSSQVAGAVSEVRHYIRSISGFRSVIIVERESNFGLARSITDGVTTLCNSFGRVIVLEDDLITAPTFLAYMNAALERYSEMHNIMQISGYTFPMPGKAPAKSFFAPLTTSWGWSVWKRSWDHFDPDMGGYDLLENDRFLRYRFDLKGAYPYWKMLLQQRSGDLDSWAICWYLSVFCCNGLILYPPVSLVQNIGFDGSGTNCGAQDIFNAPFSDQRNLAVFPDSITVEIAMMNRIADFLRASRRRTLMKRVYEKLRKTF